MVFSNERLAIIRHYADIWSQYEEKYESFPLAIQLKQKQQEVDDLKTKLQHMENRRNDLQSKIEKVKGMVGLQSYSVLCMIDYPSVNPSASLSFGLL